MVTSHKSSFQSKGTILILDDDPSVAWMHCEITELLGYEPHALTDPYKFKENYHRLKPDIVIMDVVMPGIDGMELAQWVAGEPSPPRIFVVSGFNPFYSNSLIKIIQARNDVPIQCLKKPLSIALLEHALEDSTSRDG